jgi:hypothetical protein
MSNASIGNGLSSGLAGARPERQFARYGWHRGALALRGLPTGFLARLTAPRTPHLNAFTLYRWTKKVTCSGCGSRMLDRPGTADRGLWTDYGKALSWAPCASAGPKPTDERNRCKLRPGTPKRHGNRYTWCSFDGLLSCSIQKETVMCGQKETFSERGMVQEHDGLEVRVWSRA